MYFPTCCSIAIHSGSAFGHGRTAVPELGCVVAFGAVVVHRSCLIRGLAKLHARTSQLKTDRYTFSSSRVCPEVHCNCQRFRAKLVAPMRQCSA
jgi:hypothetical protein